ncbi:MAG: phosphatase PAP2 family protein [Syntrophorhabdales bacterium]
MRRANEIRRTSLVLVAALASALFVTGCASSGSPSLANAPSVARPHRAAYLSPEALPNGVEVLPPPPEPGSAAQALDEEMSRRALAQRNTPRWMLAIEDADLRFPKAVETFSCALDASVTEEDAPHLYLLMRRTSYDASLATGAAKSYYHRIRPFVANKEPMCTPDQEESLMESGSYPSGHTTLGWMWALILAEIAPERIDAILSRGLAFGESRVVCNVHWESDVVAGRILGAGVVARLHADASFREDLEAAKAEFAAVRAKGLKPRRDCAAEAAALGK